MLTSIIFYSSYTHISPGATMGQSRPVFPDTHKIEQSVSAPEIDAITDKYTHQVFPLEYTLRMLRVAADYSRSPSETSSGSKVGISGRIKAAFDAAKAFAGAETEVGIDYEQSVGAVVKYFNNEKRIQDISFEITRINGIYQKLIAAVKVKNPFSGQMEIVEGEKAGKILEATNNSIKETLTKHFLIIQAQLNSLRGTN